MPKLLASLVLWTGSLTGLGLVLERLLYSKQESRYLKLALGENILLGFWSAALLSISINFVFALSEWISLIVLLTGWLGLYLQRNDLCQRITKQEWGFFVCLILGISILATVSYFNIDTGYYHLPTIATYKKYPLLPGIANVFGPYGHNTSWLAVEALFQLPLLGLSSTFSANSVFTLGFLLFVKKHFLARERWGFCFLFVVLFCFNHLGLGLGGVTPDLPVTLMSSVVWLLFLAAVFEKGTEDGAHLVFLLFFTSLAITIKVSALNLLLPLGVVWVVKCSQFKKTEIRMAVLLNVVFIALWICRGVLLSGCFLYPQSLTCIEQLPWAMPINNVVYWYLDIKKHLCGFAVSGTIFSHAGCLATWMHQLLREPVWNSILLLIGLSFVYRAFRLITHKRGEGQNRNIVAQSIVLAVLCGLVGMWLFSAPSVRFALWLVFALAAAGMALILNSHGVVPTRNVKYFYILLIFSWVMTFRSAWLTRPIPVEWVSWPVLPESRSKIIHSEKGIEISQPIGDIRCWDMAPPCTPDKTEFSIHRKMNRVWFKGLK